MKKYLIILLIFMLLIISCNKATTKPDNVLTQAPIPVFNLDSGEYSSLQTVNITCSLLGAEIHYTLDGSMPTDSSQIFTVPLSISSSTIIKARAYKEGYLASETATANYEINYPSVQTPIFNPIEGTYEPGQAVTISCMTAGSTIYYTTDGSTPNDSSQIFNTPIIIDSTTTIKAKAHKEGYIASQIATANYNIIIPTTATPTFSLNEGEYQSEQTVKIFCSTPNAIIHYTIDGTTPDNSSFKYNTPIVISQSQTIKAIAYCSGYIQSEIASASYSINYPMPENFVYVEGGTFSPNNDSYNVTLSSYYIGKYEITRAEWADVMTGNNNGIPSMSGSTEDDLIYPATHISWFDAMVYCNRRSIQEGLTPCYAKDGDTNPNYWGVPPDDFVEDWGTTTLDLNVNGYRLPTEMEWLFAANGGIPAQQAGTFNTFYSGSDNINDVAWYVSNAGGETHQIGTKAANELNIFDMTGNVEEWCWDKENDFPSGSYNDPVGSENGNGRIIKGGDWNSFPPSCKNDCRMSYNPYARYNTIGFRVVRRNP
jgi:formylglycine-generating enzyme required for sulfatase activity